MACIDRFQQNIKYIFNLRQRYNINKEWSSSLTITMTCQSRSICCTLKTSFGRSSWTIKMWNTEWVKLKIKLNQESSRFKSNTAVLLQPELRLSKKSLINWPKDMCVLMPKRNKFLRNRKKSSLDLWLEVILRNPKHLADNTTKKEAKASNFKSTVKESKFRKFQQIRNKVMK